MPGVFYSFDLRDNSAMIKAPRNDGDWPDRALECEEAMEDAFIRIAECMQLGGMSPEQAATELIEAAASVQHPFAMDLRQLAALAISKGWRKHEVARGIVSLAENYRRGVDAIRETERTIRRAWQEPD